MRECSQAASLHSSDRLALDTSQSSQLSGSLGACLDTLACLDWSSWSCRSCRSGNITTINGAGDAIAECAGNSLKWRQMPGVLELQVLGFLLTFVILSLDMCRIAHCVAHCAVTRMTKQNYYAIAITWKTYGHNMGSQDGSLVFYPTFPKQPRLKVYFTVELAECEIV